jgi:hypothetical protein
MVAFGVMLPASQGQPRYGGGPTIGSAADANGGVMAIYGFGAMFGGDTDVSGDFFQQDMACVGWSEHDAPPLFDILGNIGNGDLVFIKSFNPQIGLTIKAVGIVTDRTIQQYTVQGHARNGVSVRWVWRGSDPVGKIDDRYPVRSVTLFQEHTPSVQARVIGHLLAAIAPNQSLQPPSRVRRNAKSRKRPRAARG